jgi:Zn-dependent protease with chaperone function
MYNQLFFFIVALLLFTLQQPGNEAFLPPVQTFALGTAIFALYAMICRMSILRLQRRMEWTFSAAAVSLRFHRLQTRLSILALLVLGAYVYGLNIKFYLSAAPGFEESLTLSGLIGLVLYMVHLVVIWYWSYPVYRLLHGASIMTRSAYVRGNAEFQFALLIPWVLISSISDALLLAPLPVYLRSELGQTVLSGVLLIFFLLFSPWLIIRLWRCEPLPASYIRGELERFCGNHGFAVGNFLLWPLFGGEMLTAAIMGLLPRLRYILITKGLLGLLSVDELKAVVAHEMGHVRRYHLLFYLLFFIAFSVLSYSIHDTLLLAILKESNFLDWALSPVTPHLTLFFVAYTLPMLILLLVYFRYIFGFFLRNSERQADLYALQLIGHPFTLISSLDKIAYHSGRVEDVPSWHHFSISQRMRFLTDCYNDPTLVRRHHWKLYGSAVLFFAVVTVLTTMGFQFRESPTVQLWRSELEVKILEQGLKPGPERVELYAAYGGLLFEQKRYNEAEGIMRQALDEAPEHPELLNNLAWLYATSPPPYFNPEEALELALRAAARSPESPHILDTLAEAYYVNGRYQEAIEAIDKALALNPPKRDYYLGQKRRFEEDLKSASD